MKKNLRAVVPALALALAAGACEGDLTDLNVDPNNPPAVPATSLLPQAEASAVNRALGSNFNLTMAGLWSQSWAKIQYIDEDWYEVRTTTNDTHWTEFYAGSLMDMQKIIEQGDSLGIPDYVGIGTILQQWTFHIMTDTWGDIPYSEALQGSANVRPKYDAQKDIYYGMLAKLTQASTTLQGANNSFKGVDEIYGGDPAAWQRFSNSLRLRLAMRMSNVDANKARNEFLAALAAPGGVFTDNAHNAQLHYIGSVPSNNPIYSIFHEGGRYDQVISKTMVDSLKQLDDPRLAVYADPAPNGCADGGDYCGYQNGTETAEDFDALSPIGSAFRNNPQAPSVMMDYAEVLFLRAEAAARGWTGDNAATLYQSGIKASMKRHGVDSLAIETYLAQPEVAYTGLRSIYMQKWIALYGNGPEQYASWRRQTIGGDHVPFLTPAPGAQVQKVPFRLTYPAQEQSVNAENWTAAVAANGGATLYDKPVWWNTVMP
ncbi:MAG TPA: SusD/RagB family nutrient-binding outer membrane lipoprotein [Longimicrobium sp.]|nr:SusD/RagB family nutrient-binding outer membrane lipoprotein [Longimicrobium sp.]